MYGEVHYYDEILQIIQQGFSFDCEQDIDRFFDVEIRRSHHVRLLPKIDDVLDCAKKQTRKRKSREVDVYLLLMKCFARIEGKSRFGDKTNEHIRYLEELRHQFPNLRIIHVVRDPRDVVSSMISMPWASNDVLASTFRWKAELNNLQEFRMNYPKLVLEIRYEDLIKNAEEVCRQISDFIGESYSPQMLEYYKNSRNYVVNEPWKSKTSALLNTDAQEKWKKELTKNQACTVQFLVGGLLRKYDYEYVNYGLFTKMTIPVIIFVELSKYIAHKIKRRLSKGKGDEGIVFGDEKRLFQLLLKSIFSRQKYLE
jgi:hypothetical protein